MPGILREGIDAAVGIITSGSPDVFINGAPAVRIGDTVASHGQDAHSDATMAQGSSTVFVNGIPICRAGDAATCGDVGESGSSDTFAG